MGTRNRFNPCHPCCVVSPPSTCLISAGWECEVKDGISSDDLTGWAVDAGVWDATQTWESGTTADTLATSSSNARISCDTQQSQPLDDQMRVLHWVRVAHADDEAVILLAGYKVRVMADSVSILSGGTVLTTRDVGIGLDVLTHLRICTWHDNHTELDYLGVEWRTPTSGWNLVAQVTLDANGTTEFGADNVAGAVSFRHPQPDLEHRDGHFYHNTLRTDGSGLDCSGCTMVECGNCPGGDIPRYLAIAVEGLYSPTVYTYHPTADCDQCEDYNASYVLDMLARDRTLPCWAWWSTETFYCSRRIAGNTAYYCFSVLATVERDGDGWKLRVTISESGLWNMPLGDCSFGGWRTQSAVYSKTYAGDESCSAIDDDLTLESYTGDGFFAGCLGFSTLTVHATASE